MITFFKAIRPLNILIALLSCLLFRWISIHELGELIPLIAYLLSVFFVMSAGYLINDYFDFKTDSINKPEKKHFKNRNTYWVLFLIFNALAVLLSFICVEYEGYSSVPYIVSLAIVLLWMYSYLLQILPFIGNLTIALLVILFYIPLKEGYESTHITNGFMALSFMITLTREIIKDLEDKNGDLQSGYKTLPIVLGNNSSKILATFFIVVSINLLFKSFWNTLSQELSLVLLFSLIHILLIISGVILFLKTTNKLYYVKYKTASLLLKINMVLFMILVFMTISLFR